MEDWVQNALKRWPNVPALFGWLGLDRRGRWLIRGEVISRPQIIDTIARNYAADAAGRWYFQNGPQRGYMRLAYAPFVLRSDGDAGDALQLHTGEPATRFTAAYIDEQGSIVLETAAGPALLSDADLDWALARLRRADGGSVDEATLVDALALPSGGTTGLSLRIDAGRLLPLLRLDEAAMPVTLGFVRDPQPDSEI